MTIKTERVPAEQLKPGYRVILTTPEGRSVFEVISPPRSSPTFGFFRHVDLRNVVTDETHVESILNGQRVDVLQDSMT